MKLFVNLLRKHKKFVFSANPQINERRLALLLKKGTMSTLRSLFKEMQGDTAWSEFRSVRSMD